VDIETFRNHLRQKMSKHDTIRKFIGKRPKPIIRERLRHTFASQLILRGGSLKDVQELLGRKSMTMTLRYSHLTQEHKRKAVNLLKDLPTLKQSEKSTGHKNKTEGECPRFCNCFYWWS